MNMRLYDLVWVKERSRFTSTGAFEYVGQVLSMRTPNGTRMVRRVPGNPGTLIEVQESALEPVSGRAPTHVAYAEVRGKGQFPVDMLRYDACAPATFTLVEDEDTVRVSMLKALRDAGDTRLVVAQACDARGATWATERWESFGWRLRPLRVLPITNSLE